MKEKEEQTCEYDLITRASDRISNHLSNGISHDKNSREKHNKVGISILMVINSEEGLSANTKFMLCKETTKRPWKDKGQIGTLTGTVEISESYETTVLRELNEEFPVKGIITSEDFFSMNLDFRALITSDDGSSICCEQKNYMIELGFDKLSQFGRFKHNTREGVTPEFKSLEDIHNLIDNLISNRSSKNTKDFSKQVSHVFKPGFLEIIANLISTSPALSDSREIFNEQSSRSFNLPIKYGGVYKEEYSPELYELCKNLNTLLNSYIEYEKNVKNQKFY